jgi:hypothetical protein
MSAPVRVALGLVVGALLATLPFLHFRYGADRHDAAPGGSHASHAH